MAVYGGGSGLCTGRGNGKGDETGMLVSRGNLQGGWNMWDRTQEKDKEEAESCIPLK